MEILVWNAISWKIAGQLHRRMYSEYISQAFPTGEYVKVVGVGWRSENPWSCRFLLTAHLSDPSIETSPTPQEASGPSGPKCPGECPRECPPKSGCPRECRGSVSGDLRAPGPRVSKRCPESVYGVSGDLFHTLSLAKIG